MGMSGKRRTEEWNLGTDANAEDKAAVDRRQNNKMLSQCPSGIAQRPPHHAIAVPTAMQNRVTMSVAPPLGNKWSKKSPTLQPSSTSLLLISSVWTSFFVRVHLTSLLLISPGLWSRLCVSFLLSLYTDSSYVLRLCFQRSLDNRKCLRVVFYRLVSY